MRFPFFLSSHLNIHIFLNLLLNDKTHSKMTGIMIVRDINCKITAFFDTTKIYDIMLLTHKMKDLYLSIPFKLLLLPVLKNLMTVLMYSKMSKAINVLPISLSLIFSSSHISPGHHNNSSGSVNVHASQPAPG